MTHKKQPITEEQRRLLKELCTVGRRLSDSRIIGLEVISEVRFVAYFVFDMEPDYIDWCCYDKWTVEEATALLAGIDPTYLTWDVFRQIEKEAKDLGHENAQRYAKVKRYLERKWDSAGYVKLEPAEFIGWAQHKKISFPDELAELALELERAEALEGEPGSAIEPSLEELGTFFSTDGGSHGVKMPGKLEEAVEIHRAYRLERNRSDVEYKSDSEIHAVICDQFRTKGKELPLHTIRIKIASIEKAWVKLAYKKSE